MRAVPSNKTLMKKYELSEKELFDILNKCVNYYLSEEELYELIEEYYFKLEMKYNKRYQTFFRR